MGGAYTSFEEHLTVTYTKPCPNCQHLFQRGQSVTQYDIATGDIDGPIPSGYVLENNARQRVCFVQVILLKSEYLFTVV